eukprot:TRINITY_DN12832_c0_g1_i1.p1 TRINITY_DN12832_c0_g1~~TRINITY_DN12832_c0_g1_i1.p1  ORF type:complete len:230 (-),score=53.29 TRINITY_DN12832_c0_g1_i1:88-777(-)
MEEIKKSYYEANPVKEYCLDHSTPLHPVQKKLLLETLEIPQYKMMGAPEVVALNALFIKNMGAKKVIDVGVFTGASSLAAALALPKDGKVLACDVSKEYTQRAEKYWEEAGVRDMVELVLAPATETLQKKLDSGEEGTYDFAFIDADKQSYDSYYELCLQLLRKGGMIAFDNTLYSGRVLTKDVYYKDNGEIDLNTESFKVLNKKISKDSRVTAVLMNIGDGLTLVVKN